jgi:hypothetical protein
MVEVSAVSEDDQSTCIDKDGIWNKNMPEGSTQKRTIKVVKSAAIKAKTTSGAFGLSVKEIKAQEDAEAARLVGEQGKSKRFPFSLQSSVMGPTDRNKLRPGVNAPREERESLVSSGRLVVPTQDKKEHILDIVLQGKRVREEERRSMETRGVKKIRSEEEADLRKKVEALKPFEQMTSDLLRVPTLTISQLESAQAEQERKKVKADRRILRAAGREVIAQQVAKQIESDRVAAEQLQQEEQLKASLLAAKADATTDSMESNDKAEQVVVDQLLDRLAQHKIKVCDYRDKTQYVDVAGHTGHTVRFSTEVMHQAFQALKEKESDEWLLRGDKSEVGKAALF